MISWMGSLYDQNKISALLLIFILYCATFSVLVELQEKTSLHPDHHTTWACNDLSIIVITNVTDYRYVMGLIAETNHEPLHRIQ